MEDRYFPLNNNLNTLSDIIEYLKHDPHCIDSEEQQSEDQQKKMDLFKIHGAKAFLFEISPDILEVFANTEICEQDLNQELKLPFDELFLQFDYYISEQDLGIPGVLLFYDNGNINLEFIYVRGKKILSRIAGSVSTLEHVNDCIKYFKNEYLSNEIRFKDFRWKSLMEEFNNTTEQNYSGADKEAEKMIMDMHRIIFNFLQFLDTKDIQFTTIAYEPSQREKREHRGKYGGGTTKILLSNKLRKYLDYMKEVKSHSDVNAHWVRGHWMHFTADRYKAAKDKKTWVEHFIRGKGYPSKRDYVVKS